ncbi:uncharacterized protein LOC108739175 isoform X1 [Agrilus planipennis]|uniref:Uncharacterized protein LOC108739175 isoform X1 n=1 Tax=Agrilus planipennis TaxID=224129 RepID=A0A7F5RD18_AGRPL|nr:uncharacterized protein LOC108739175 isoform X1 [Agrilus planipennis]
MKIVSALFLGAVFVAQTWSYSEIGTFTMGQGCLLCTEEYEPICGANSEGIRKTFGNDCELVEWNCLVGDDYKHISHGICSEFRETMINHKLFSTKMRSNFFIMTGELFRQIPT